MNLNRVKNLNYILYSGGPILYWMDRDQRVNDNWALIYAQELSIKYKSPFAVIFCLYPEFRNLNSRQYEFMLNGLVKIDSSLKKKNIPFYILTGNPSETLPEFINTNKIGILISDFSPLKNVKLFKEKISKKINIPFYEVDTHNIVPVWVASDKLEFGAYTIRPKIKRNLSEYLETFPQIKKQKYNWEIRCPEINWNYLKKYLRLKTDATELTWLKSGEDEAIKLMKLFINKKLKHYSFSRNDPNQDGQSNLSPYLNLGQISSQRIALEVIKVETNKVSKEAFLEELIIRKELSDNFCYYNPNYDSFNGFPNWAKETLNKHRYDKREYIYTLRQFEEAETHDSLWNAAQIEMLEKGKMHGYMRMYWAKKILEWTRHPEDALNIATELNDKYELDGNDPNGYTGIAWSIGGVHDRAWGERNVFGKIRYMNYSGCKHKFDVKSYIKKFIPINL